MFPNYRRIWSVNGSPLMKNIKLVTQCLNELHTCITRSIMPLFEPRLIPPMLNNYIIALDLIKKHLTQTPMCTHTVCWPETSVLWFRSTCYIYSWTFWDPIKLITALIRCVAIKTHTQKHADNRQFAHSGNMGTNWPISGTLPSAFPFIQHLLGDMLTSYTKPVHQFNLDTVLINSLKCDDSFNNEIHF